MSTSEAPTQDAIKAEGKTKSKQGHFPTSLSFGNVNEDESQHHG